MLKPSVAAVVLVALLSSSGAAQDAQTIISDASKTLGAADLKSIQYSGSGSEFAFGQAFNPNLPWPAFEEKSLTRTINFETPAWRVDRILADISPQRRGGGLPPAATQTVVVTANTPWPQQLVIWMTPPGFLKAARANNATVKSQTTGGKKYNVVTFEGPNHAKVNGYISDQNTVDRVETWVDDPVLGDTLLEAIYTDYKDHGGVKFPTRIVQRQGGSPILDLAVTTVIPNAPADLRPPQGTSPPAGGAQPPATTSLKLADGVFVILGGYATVAVDFKDFVVAIEGPQSEARANAIIAEIHRLIPNKPIKYVVNTHSHFDHSSGLRAFVAEGATVVTHEINKTYYERVLAGSAPHALNPDTQAEKKKKVTVETVADRKVLTDGNHIVELHRLQGSLHNAGFIMAYLPKEKILVEADAFNAPAVPGAAPGPIAPNTANLMANLDRLKLDFGTIVPIHYPADNRIVNKAELMRAVGRAN